MNVQEAIAQWRADQPRLAEYGVHLSEGAAYIPDGFGRDINLAMDAQPTMFTVANAGVPAFLGTLIDPGVIEILFSPLNAEKIYGAVKKGSWEDPLVMFSVIEHVGEVSSYGDFNENGHVGVNVNWPARQNYLFQTIKEYGELELARAGLAKIDWAAQLDKAAARALMTFMNTSFFFGIAGLQNYGSLNSPGLSAALTPATKAAGGVKWVVNGVIVATANEIYADIQSLYIQLVTQTGGLIKADTPMVLAMSPGSEAAMTATNSFNVNVNDLIKKNFPNIRIETATQFTAQGASNPQGLVAGNLIQLIATEIQGQKTGFAAFSEKMRSHPIIRAMSSFKQKLTAGTWGSVIQQPIAISSMVGV